MKPYIAGPMKGYPEHNCPAFIEAEKILRELGHDPVNPIHHSDGVGTDLPYEYYIRESVKDVLIVDSLVLISGWGNSKGANLEFHIANMLGLPIYALKGRELIPMDVWTNTMWDYNDR